MSAAPDPGGETTVCPRLELDMCLQHLDDHTTPLEVRVREEPLRTWVTPVGELDLHSCDVLDRRLWEAQATSRRVVLDLRALEFLDSVGLRSIVAARLRAIDWRRHLEIVCGSGQVRRLLELSGHERLLAVVEPPGRPPSLCPDVSRSQLSASRSHLQAAPPVEGSWWT